MPSVTRRMLSSALLTAGLVASPALSVPAHATAATALRSAPACVKWKNNQWKMRIEVRNTCRRRYRVKIIIAFGPDSSCWTYKPGQRRDYYGWSGRVDQLRLC